MKREEREKGLYIDKQLGHSSDGSHRKEKGARMNRIPVHLEAHMMGIMILTKKTQKVNRTRTS